MLPLPAHVVGTTQRDQHLQLLLEELVVVLEVETEQREGLGERTTAGHDLGAPTREQVDGREVLEDAHRVVGTEHGHGAREPDTFGASCRRRHHDRRRRHDEVGSVMLADTEHVEPELIGELDLGHQVPHALFGADRATRLGIGVELREGEQADLHGSG